MKLRFICKQYDNVWRWHVEDEATKVVLGRIETKSIPDGGYYHWEDCKAVIEAIREAPILKIEHIALKTRKSGKPRRANKRAK